MKKIAVIGSGSWGTALASLLGEKGYRVSLWSYEASVVAEIENTRVNMKYLPEVILPKTIVSSVSLSDVVSDAEIVISVVPVQYTRSTIEAAASLIPKGARMITASKGIENGTLLTVSQMLKKLTGHEVAALSGPSFAREVVSGLPTAVTIAHEKEEEAEELQQIFNTEHFRVYTNNDVLGVELGGALKNVMAIAAGMSDGLSLGSNARAALITRGLAEIIRLGVAMGAQEKTFGGLSGIGDLVLTCTGPLSRNYTVGTRLGRGEKLKDIMESMSMVAEGISTSESAYQLAEKYGVEMPVVEQVYMTIHDNKPPAAVVRDLMSRSLKSEHYR